VVGNPDHTASRRTALDMATNITATVRCKKKAATATLIKVLAGVGALIVLAASPWSGERRAGREISFENRISFEIAWQEYRRAS